MGEPPASIHSQTKQKISHLLVSCVLLVTETRVLFNTEEVDAATPNVREDFVAADTFRVAECPAQGARGDARARRGRVLQLKRGAARQGIREGRLRAGVKAQLERRLKLRVFIVLVGTGKQGRCLCRGKDRRYQKRN